MTGRTPVEAQPALLRRAAVRLWRITGFVLYFGYEFAVSNVLVLQEILRWRRRARPAILEVRLRSRSKLEVVSIANLLTLTPGTLSVEVCDDPPTLYVHGMFAGDPAAFRRQLTALEDRMLAAMRPVAADPAGGTGGPDPERR